MVWRPFVSHNGLKHDPGDERFRGDLTKTGLLQSHHRSRPCKAVFSGARRLRRWPPSDGLLLRPRQTLDRGHGGGILRAWLLLRRFEMPQRLYGVPDRGGGVLLLAFHNRCLQLRYSFLSVRIARLPFSGLSMFERGFSVRNQHIRMTLFAVVDHSDSGIPVAPFMSSRPSLPCFKAFRSGVGKGLEKARRRNRLGALSVSDTGARPCDAVLAAHFRWDFKCRLTQP
jgi:hypothetical protein